MAQQLLEKLRVLLRITISFFPDTDLKTGQSSDDDDMGPVLPSAAPKKKRRTLPYEKLYIAALPESSRYSKSLMHKEQLSFVTFTPYTSFLITSSVDGVVKFWKKTSGDVEFVKEFRAHIGEIKCVTISADGRNFASIGSDKTVKIFDVLSFGGCMLCPMGPLDANNGS